MLSVISLKKVKGVSGSKPVQRAKKQRKGASRRISSLIKISETGQRSWTLNISTQNSKSVAFRWPLGRGTLQEYKCLSIFLNRNWRSMEYYFWLYTNIGVNVYSISTDNYCESKTIKRNVSVSLFRGIIYEYFAN